MHSTRNLPCCRNLLSSETRAQILQLKPMTRLVLYGICHLTTIRISTTSKSSGELCEGPRCGPFFYCYHQMTSELNNAIRLTVRIFLPDAAANLRIRSWAFAHAVRLVQTSRGCSAYRSTRTTIQQTRILPCFLSRAWYIGTVIQ